jgi:hypothetical protein
MSSVSEIECTNIAGLVGLQLESGEQFLIAPKVVQLLTEQSSDNARKGWSRIMQANNCLKPSKDLLEAPTSTDWAFHYKTKAGKVTVALRIPGIEFVVQNMSGQTASANKEKFLLLIDDWKQQQSHVLGKRPAPKFNSGSSSKQARIANNDEMFQLAVIKQLQTSGASVENKLDKMDGELVSVSTEVRETKQELVKTGSQVQDGFLVVSAEMRETKEELVSTGSRLGDLTRSLLDRDANISTLHFTIGNLQAKNEKQTFMLGKLNAELVKLKDDHQRSTSSDIAQIKADVAQIKASMQEIKDVIWALF